MPILSWLTRDEDLKAARRAPYRLLEEDPALGHGDPAAANMLIQGDNLEALKALLPFYAGRVKCIYIDPPYNTRSAFEHYDDNLEHSRWLAMMWPRLELLRELLSEDGSIWVSIDDNEGHYLKVIMDEVFGRSRAYATFVWQKVDSPNDNNSPVNPDHEFVLCYSNRPAKDVFEAKPDPSILDAYPGVMDDGTRYRDRLIRKNGKASLRSDRPSMWFPLTAPDGTEVYPIHDDGREGRWAFGEEGIKGLIDTKRLIWKRRPAPDGSEKWVPYSREFAPAAPTRPHQTILLDVKTSRQAKAHARELLPDAEPFETIKPEHLVKRIFEISTKPGDLVLDSFLGSGTTAAVALKMDRRFIGIEKGEHAVSHCRPRLVKVIAGEPGGISDAVDWTGGGGFRFYRLGEAVFGDDGALSDGIAFAPLAAHIWFAETGQAPIASPDGPVLGVDGERAIALLYNGVLGDKRPDGGNVLTRQTLAVIREHLPADFDGELIVYGERSALSVPSLVRERIVFRQTPYDVKARR